MGSPIEFGYRNKMEFSFGDEFKDGPLSLGLHKKGSTYDVLTASDCKLVHPDMTAILSCVLDFFTELGAVHYKKMQHTGYLRHLASSKRGNLRRDSGSRDYHKPGPVRLCAAGFQTALPFPLEGKNRGDHAHHQRFPV